VAENWENREWLINSVITLQWPVLALDAGLLDVHAVRRTALLRIVIG